MKNRNSWSILLCLVIVCSALNAFSLESYIEDFSITNSKHPATTADWNTADGELKLFPFVSELQGIYNTTGSARGVAIAGNVAYVADGYSGLQIVDIFVPETPIALATYNTPGYAYDVQVAGNYAYVADWNSGLQVIDISAPWAPVLVGTYDTFGAALSVKIDGDIAVVSDGSAGLLVLDISNPPTPSYIGAYSGAGTNARGLSIAGDHVYLADGANGLKIFDISDPFVPTLVSTFVTTANAYDVVIAGNYAYVVDQGAGLRIVDISNPAAPVGVGIYAAGGLLLGLSVSGDLAFLTNSSVGLHVIDISDPTLPVLDQLIDTNGQAYDVAIAGEYAFVADFSSGLQAITIRQAIEPYAVGGNTSWDVISAEISGLHAYAAARNDGFKVYDLSNAGSMPTVGSYSTVAETWDVAISGDYAYLATAASGLLILDISDPTLPVYVSNVATTGQATGVFISGYFAYVASWTGGLDIVNVLDPTLPVLVGNVATTNHAWRVVTSGDYAFVATQSSTMEIFDISNSLSPLPVGSHTMATGTAESVFVDGDIAYLAGGSEGLLIFSIYNPAAPALAGTLDTGGYAYDVTVAGDRAYIAIDGLGLAEADISSPGSPALLSTNFSSGNSLGVTLSGGTIYASNQQGGLQKFQVLQRDVDTLGNIGISYQIDADVVDVVRARLTSVQDGQVSWAISADNYSTWQDFTPGSGWQELTNQGSSLVWRSTHSYSLGVMSAVSSLQIDWLNDFARIESITDIANDQGRQVSLEWSRSGHDFLGDSQQIVEYAVYREIDAGLSKRAAQPKAPDLSGASVSLRDNAEIMLNAGWHYVTSVPVLVEDYYAVVVPTLADSTITDGQYLSTFKVVALTATPGVYFTSPSASGFSTDNLAPGAPTAIMAAYESSSVVLDWDDAPESDFQYFRVYRDTDPGFVPSPGNLVMEVAASAWTDSSVDPWNNHYKMTTVDFNGNESPIGVVDVVSGVPDSDVVSMFALGNAVPNPFNPVTEIHYSVPTAGKVQLTIFDIAGREVRTLVNEDQDLGSYSVQWNGLSGNGSRAPSGVYLYQLRAGDHVERKRMTLLK